MTGGTVKRCTKCGIEKPPDEFHKMRNWLQSWCKSCMQEYQREYGKREDVREHRREYIRRRRLSAPEMQKREQEREIKKTLAMKGTKCCIGCLEVKPLNAFHKDAKAADGHVSRCKGCVKKYLCKYRSSIDVKDREREYQRVYIQEYKQRPGVKDRLRERDRKWYGTPHGRIVRKIKDHRRRVMRKHAAAVTDEQITLAQWEAIIKHQGNKCPDCGKRFSKNNPPTMDHIVPLSLIPLHSSDNIRAVCGSCNSSKGAHIDPGLIQTWIYAGSTGNKIE
jgi:hypothetical protein